MIHRDYIMRLIEQMIAVLARVLFNKELHNYDQAMIEIDNSLRSMFGWGTDFTTTLSGDELLAKLESVEGQYWEKCLVAAELINEEAQVFTLKNGHSPMVADLYCKALQFYVEALKNARDYNVNAYLFKIDNLINTITQDDLPEQDKLKICEYYEWTGNYAKAEDLYYELLDANSDHTASLLYEFYSRLLAKTDAELVSGNLPRNEVLDGIHELQARKLI